MLKEALQYLVGLKDNKTYTINGLAYSDKELCRVDPYIPHPTSVDFASLDGVVKFIRAEGLAHVHPIYIRIDEPTRVSVLSGLDSEAKRYTLCVAKNTDVNFAPGWRDQQTAVIELRSRFIPTDDTAYLLDLLSRMSSDSEVSSVDNGVSQTVTVRQGVSLKENVSVKPAVSLRPFRTFREVCQPESEFLLRVRDNNQVGLFEADGGIWKMEAKANIANYFRTQFADLLMGETDDGFVVVME
jgi:hypothetical protein